MSAGPFVLSRYQASYGAGTAIHPIRVQPETLAASVAGGTAIPNSPPTGATTNPLSAHVSGGRRSLGLVPRKITLRFGATPPTGYAPNGLTTIPWLTPFPASFAKGNTISYLGVSAVVVSLTPESAR